MQSDSSDHEDNDPLLSYAIEISKAEASKGSQNQMDSDPQYVFLSE